MLIKSTGCLFVSKYAIRHFYEMSYCRCLKMKLKNKTVWAQVDRPEEEVERRAFSWKWKESERNVPTFESAFLTKLIESFFCKQKKWIFRWHDSVRKTAKKAYSISVHKKALKAVLFVPARMIQSRKLILNLYYRDKKKSQWNAKPVLF